MRRIKRDVRSLYCSTQCIAYCVLILTLSLILFLLERNSNTKQDGPDVAVKSAQTRRVDDVQTSTPFSSVTKRRSDVMNVLSNLSFLDPFTPDCESIFQNDADKETKLAEFQEILHQIERHNDIVMATKQKLLAEPGKCYVGHALNFMEETYVMAKLFSADFVNTICETGFNAGHSTLLWLLLKPDVKVISFDINQYKCTDPMAKLLKARFGDRLQLVFGDSTKTLPQFKADHPDVVCDVTIVDGGHTRAVAEADILNFYNLTSDLNYVFMDNYPDENFSRALAYGWENAKRRGLIHELFRCGYSHAAQGFTFGRYVH